MMVVRVALILLLTGCQIIAVPQGSDGVDWQPRPTPAARPASSPSPLPTTLPSPLPPTVQTSAPTPLPQIVITLLPGREDNSTPVPTRMRRKIWPDFPWQDGWALYLIPLGSDQEGQIKASLSAYVNTFALGRQIKEEDSYDYAIIVADKGKLYREETVNLIQEKGWKTLGAVPCMRHRRSEGLNYTICGFTREYPRVNMSSYIAALFAQDDAIDMLVVLRWNKPF